MGKKSVKRTRRTHSHEFRLNAVSMVEDQSYTTAAAARELGINENLLRTWRTKYGKKSRESLDESEQEELFRRLEALFDRPAAACRVHHASQLC